MPQESTVQAMKEHLRLMIEAGDPPEVAAGRLIEHLALMRVPDPAPAVSAALESYQADISKQEFLPVASVPRRRRTQWYGGPSPNGIWAGLRRYLVETKKWPEETTVRSLDESSTKIVSLLEPPGLTEFSTRGLVVGYVQSGKTANMTAVIAKAVDATYRFVVVLAGMTDALRTQTQQRLETDLVAHSRDRWHLWTTPESDFTQSSVLGFPALNPSDSHLAVLKKNKFVLERFLDALRNTPRQRLRDISFLIIDDECDQASVNAPTYKDQITAINDLIRTTLHTLPKCAYIGYTATPFANVLIDPTVSVAPNKPDDLYPRDFIVALPYPEAYFGAESLFGRGLLYADEDEPDSEGYDMIRVIDDAEVPYLRPGSPRERECFALTVTESLDEAIRYYLLASAARVARGQGNQHSSMLIHTTVYVAPHFDAQQRIREHVAGLRNAVRANDAGLLRELRNLWEREAQRLEPATFGNANPDFKEIRSHLANVTESVQVVVENGTSDERLDFSGETGKHYIVVGGSVLARGLTIEGLVVSYFLRTSSQYDSLMQMGRWFGYRKGYEDLPRVWMTRDMRDAFKELATVEAEIRNDIDVYHLEENTTPLDYAVRIRQIPGMSVTAKNKMLNARECNISYSGEHIQTTRFRHTDAAWLESNWNAGAQLIEEAQAQAGGAIERPRGRLFEEVPAGAIKRFLTAYLTHHSHRDFRADKVIEYIDSENGRFDAYLGYWSVGIIEPKDGAQSSQPLGPLGHVRTVIRSLLWETRENDADIKALMSRGDLLIDLPSETPVRGDGWAQLKKRRAAAGRTDPLLLLYPIEAESRPRRSGRLRNDGKQSRDALNASRDVLGAAILFPESPAPGPTNYVRVELPPQEHEEPELQELHQEERS